MKRINLKNLLIALSMVLLLGFIVYEMKAETRRCMGISFITEEELQYRAIQQVDLGNIVYLENQLVPYDQYNNKILLPCQVTQETKFYELEGQLTSALPGYDLYFLWEDAFNILFDAVKYSCKFTLYAIDKNGNYMPYYLNFTTLPIIEMNGTVDYIDDREREVYNGEITVWEPKAPETARLRVQKSGIEWHVRGFSSESFIKKSLKLNLKERSGNNNSLSFCGFESDDDYILNPMWFDDVKVREKLIIDLWNEMADEKGSNLKMSGGEYCELVINGEYQGLRLLQKKIEGDYLKLDEDDVLLKGQNVNLGTTRPPERVYEVVYSNQNDETDFEAISGFFYQTDFSYVNLEAWADLQAFMLLGNLRDNEYYKNIYYVIERDGDQESISFIPWDTDMSFGIYWNDGFRLLPETVETVSFRMEYDNLLKQYPETKEILEERWKELRQTIFTEENIMTKIDSYRTYLENAGAIFRDYNVLGWYSWGDRDTVEGLKTYIERRLEVIDERYK